MGNNQTFRLSEQARAAAEEILARKVRAIGERARGDALSPVQVLFYDSSAFDFGFAWEAGDPANRWLFPVEAEGPTFIYYVCMRLQQIGFQAGQVLFATAGEGALFYATLAIVDRDSKGVVGLLPQDTQPSDFGSTLYSLAPDATLTLISSMTAGDQTYEGNLYKGSDLVGPLAAYVNGKVVATDQAIVWNGDGTATTTGNVWLGDPATGTANILCPAPPDGESQSFPLDPNATCD